MDTIYLLQRKTDPMMVAWTLDPIGSLLPDPESWEMRFVQRVSPNREADGLEMRRIADAFKRDGHMIISLRPRPR
jgi:hypothetical protein